MVWTRPGFPKQSTVHVGRDGATGFLPAWKNTTGIAGLQSKAGSELRKLYTMDVNGYFMAKA